MEYLTYEELGLIQVSRHICGRNMAWNTGEACEPVLFAHADKTMAMMVTMMLVMSQVRM